MSLLTANSISKSFGDLDVFSDISLSIPPKARIGFVGENGSGKTTLLKILVAYAQIMGVTFIELSIGLTIFGVSNSIIWAFIISFL